MMENISEIHNQLWDEPTEDEQYVRELEEQLSVLEPRVWEIIEALPEHERMLLEGFLSASAELQYRMVGQAYKRGRKIGQAIGENKNKPLYR